MLASTNHGDLGEQSTHLHVVLEWAHKARRRKMTEGTVPSSRQQGRIHSSVINSLFIIFSLSSSCRSVSALKKRSHKTVRESLKNHKGGLMKLSPRFILGCCSWLSLWGFCKTPTYASMTIRTLKWSGYLLASPSRRRVPWGDRLYIRHSPRNPQSLAQELVHSSLSGMVFWVTGEMSRG